MYLPGVPNHALIVLLSRKRPLLQGLTVTQYIHSLFLLHFLVAAEIRIMIGSTNNSIQIILFLLSVDPEVGVVAQFPIAIVVFKVVHNIVEVLACSVIDRIGLDP